VRLDAVGQVEGTDDRFQLGVAGLGQPARLQSDGTVTAGQRSWNVDLDGLPPGMDTELLVEGGGLFQGRFLMTPLPGARPTPEQRQLAIAFADQVGAALASVTAELAVVTGLPAPFGKVPKSLALAVAAVSELVEGRLLRRHPSVPLEAARMSTSQMSFDIGRARQELGYAPRPAVEALEASARWFAASGMVSEGRLSRIRWSSDR